MKIQWIAEAVEKIEHVLNTKSNKFITLVIVFILYLFVELVQSEYKHFQEGSAAIKQHEVEMYKINNLLTDINKHIISFENRLSKNDEAVNHLQRDINRLYDLLQSKYK